MIGESVSGDDHQAILCNVLCSLDLEAATLIRDRCLIQLVFTLYDKVSQGYESHHACFPRSTVTVDQVLD